MDGLKLYTVHHPDCEIWSCEGWSYVSLVFAKDATEAEALMVEELRRRKFKEVGKINVTNFEIVAGWFGSN